MTDWIMMLPDGQPSYIRDDVVYDALKVETAKGFFNQERTTNEVAAHLLGDQPDTLPAKIARTRLYLALAKIAKLEKWTRQGPPIKSRFGMRRPWVWGTPAPDRPSDGELAFLVLNPDQANGMHSQAIAWARWVLRTATTKDPDPQP